MASIAGDVWSTGIRTYQAWRADRTLRLGAGLAYYGLFTIVPFFAITAAIAKPVLGSAEVTDYIAGRLDAFGLTDADVSAATVTDQLGQASTRASLGLIGLVSLLFASSLLFLALTDAISTIWDEPVRPGWWNVVRRRLLSFAMVLVSSAAIVFHLAVTAIVGAAEAIVPGDFGVFDTLAPLLASGISWAGLAGIAVLLFRFMSPARVAWTDAIIAGTLTAGFAIVASSGVGWYLQRFGGGSLTGAFGAILALLTWVYAQAQIVLAGVQLSKVLTVGADGERSRPVDEAKRQTPTSV